MRTVPGTRVLVCWKIDDLRLSSAEIPPNVVLFVTFLCAVIFGHGGSGSLVDLRSTDLCPVRVYGA